MATYAPQNPDDAAFTVGSQIVSPIGGLADEAATDSVDEGDVGALRMTLDRKLLTRVVGSTDANRLEVSAAGAASENLAQVAGNSVTAGAGSVAAGTQRVTLASDDPAVASLGIIDDWDESDRAKVNPIAGQAGVQGGSGAVSALTQRVVLATDVALPTGANSIGDIANITTSITPGNGAANLGKSQGDVANSADIGVGALVRNVASGIYDLPNLDAAGLGSLVTSSINDVTTPLYLNGFNSADTFTTTGNGSTQFISDAFSNIAIARNFSLQVIQTGTVTSWDVRLEVSLDNGVTFGTFLTHTNADGSGAVKTSASFCPCFKFRTRCAGIILGAGTNVTAYIVASS